MSHNKHGKLMAFIAFLATFNFVLYVVDLASSMVFVRDHHYAEAGIMGALALVMGICFIVNVYNYGRLSKLSKFESYRN